MSHPKTQTDNVIASTPYRRYLDTQRCLLDTRLHSPVPAESEAAKHQFQTLPVRDALNLLNEMFEGKTTTSSSIVQGNRMVNMFVGFTFILSFFPDGLSFQTVLTSLILGSFFLSLYSSVKKTTKNYTPQIHLLAEQLLSSPLPVEAVSSLIHLIQNLRRDDSKNSLYPLALQCLHETLIQEDITALPTAEKENTYLALRNFLKTVRDSPTEIPLALHRKLTSTLLITLEPDRLSNRLITYYAHYNTNPEIKTIAEIVQQQQALATNRRG